ncbi:hypothetical protein [Streptomyces sp. CB09001]|nr:hypothetical protein [Streptomyces sp. CB09001]
MDEVEVVVAHSVAKPAGGSLADRARLRPFAPGCEVDVLRARM